MSEGVSVVVVVHSVSGRTRALADAVARGVRAVESATAHVLSVEEATSAHGQGLLAAADAIVLGSPTYMGSASAPFKAFMDATAAVWALQGWRDKLAAGFTHSAALSGDKLGTLTQLAVFAAQHGMIWVGLGLPPTYASIGDPEDDTNRLGSHLGAMAQSRPGGGSLPAGDVKTAEYLGRRVAEAAARWSGGGSGSGSGGGSGSGSGGGSERHAATRSWAFPSDRVEIAGVQRINLRELVARGERFEHQLFVCATVGGVQLEVTTASEPLYFSHINLSDEYAIALPTGDDLVDRFPLRTFLTDPVSGDDVGRYNHRIGDLVLHPEGLLHWPGRLRAPYEPFDFPPGMRRCGLSLVYCASVSTPATRSPLPRPAGREEDAKAYVSPAPPMVLASTRGEAGVLARIGSTSLALVELPERIAPAHGGWVVVLEATAGGVHAPCDLLRIPEGASLAGAGIVRALVLTSDVASPDPIPAAWTALPSPPFAAFEDSAPGALPLDVGALHIAEKSKTLVTLGSGGVTTEVPRYWLARMLFRVALHGLRLGYAETYGGFFIDDRKDAVVLGLRGEKGSPGASITLARSDALRVIERMYRAVAPSGYRERPA